VIPLLMQSSIVEGKAGGQYLQHPMDLVFNRPVLPDQTQPSLWSRPFEGEIGDISDHCCPRGDPLFDGDTPHHWGGFPFTIITSSPPAFTRCWAIAHGVSNASTVMPRPSKRRPRQTSSRTENSRVFSATAGCHMVNPTR
jgi:hypothetical protein